LAAIVLASLDSIAFGEILDFRTAFRSESPRLSLNTASFVAVEAIPEENDTNPAQAFAGGYFSGEFVMGVLEPISSQNAEDGVLVGFKRDRAAGVWATNWSLQVQCEVGDARITDVAIARTGEIYVCGTFEGNAWLDRPPPLPRITLTGPPAGGAPVSFIATADPGGAWLDAFVVSGMEARSLALDASNNIFVTGPPVLARRLDRTGQVLWSVALEFVEVEAPPSTLSLQQIAADFAADARSLYVLGTYDSDPDPGTINQDAILVRLNKLSGAVDWQTSISSRGEVRAGGLGIGPLGDLRISVSSTGDDLQVGGEPLQDLPTIDSRHAHLLFISPRGLLFRDRLLGNSSTQGGEMNTRDLAIDYAGNTYVSTSFSGSYEFEGVTYTGQEDAAIVAIDALATPIRFTNTAGASSAFGAAVAAPDRNQQILVGSIGGNKAENFGEIIVSTFPNQLAYFSAIEPVSDQQPYILTSLLPDTTIESMTQGINRAGGEIYRALDFPNEKIRLVAAYLTTKQRSGLGQLFTSLPDVDLQRDGLVSDSGWALAALNSAPPTPVYSYTYPETCHQTALYLIDTAIDPSSGHFASNTNLSIGASILVRGTGDPSYSSPFGHGTKMLSMIASPIYGAAQGTPINVISYDIYPDGATAKLSSLIEAIGLANSDKALNYPFDPAVYCIASSATTPSVSPASLEAAIDYAIGSYVYATVLVSAGNTDHKDASRFTPSDLGSKLGVICVGAIARNNLQVASTRGPDGVDLWAPGDTVAAADVFGNLTTASGTSPATALAAATALIYLSGNPVLTPADLETAVVITHSQSHILDPITYIPSTGVPGVMDFPDWTSWYDLTNATFEGNDDGDNWTNEEEYIWGFNPRVIDYEGSLLVLSYDAESSTLTIEFPLSCALYQPSALMAPYYLRDASTLSVQQSSDLQTWNDITSMITLVEEGHGSNQVTISFDYVVNTAPCFFRVRVQ
jgi:hypothetical protein